MRAYCGVAGGGNDAAACSVVLAAPSGAARSKLLEELQLGRHLPLVLLRALGKRGRDLDDFFFVSSSDPRTDKFACANEIQILGDLVLIPRERQRVVDVAKAEEHDSARKRADHRIDAGILGERESENRR